MLKIQNVSFGYNTHQVLRNINFETQKGEILGVLGPNGSGKSTLIRCISGILPGFSGTISINGQSTATLNTVKRARWISVVPQNASLPSAFTAMETVLLGRTPYINFLGQISQLDREIACSALEQVDALELSERVIGELSGGEKQRVNLARALAQSAPIMLLDEPTSSLDLQHQMKLLSLVKKLAKENSLTVVIALHDLNLAARFADRIALLVNGELKALGTPWQVLKADILAEAYSWPVKVIDHPFFDTPLILPESVL